MRVENLNGGRDLFPHIYGALRLEAVVRFDPVPLADDGTLIVAPLLADDESNRRSGR